MRIGRKPHLARPVGGPDARALDRHAPAAERDLAVLPAMAHRGPVGVVLALRADDLLDLVGHQLAEHAEPDRQGQQRLFRRAAQLAQRLLHPPRQHLKALPADLPVGLVLYGPHAVLLSSQRSRTRREDRHLKFYELRDNLRSPRSRRSTAPGTASTGPSPP